MTVASAYLHQFLLWLVLDLLTNIRIAWKLLTGPGTSTLAYYTLILLEGVKRFMTNASAYLHQDYVIT
jgi:hypothetical protein